MGQIRNHTTGFLKHNGKNPYSGIPTGSPSRSYFLLGLDKNNQTNISSVRFDQKDQQNSPSNNGQLLDPITNEVNRIFIYNRMSEHKHVLNI